MDVELRIYRGINFMGDEYEFMPNVYAYLHYAGVDVMFCFDIYQDYDKKFIIHLN